MDHLSTLRANKFDSLSLKRCIKGLARHVQEEFDITLSVSQMLKDEKYRHNTLRELRILEDGKVNDKLDVITLLAIPFVANENTHTS